MYQSQPSYKQSADQTVPAVPKSQTGSIENYRAVYAIALLGGVLLSCSVLLPWVTLKNNLVTPIEVSINGLGMVNGSISDIFQDFSHTLKYNDGMIAAILGGVSIILAFTSIFTNQGAVSLAVIGLIATGLMYYELNNIFTRLEASMGTIEVAVLRNAGAQINFGIYVGLLGASVTTPSPKERRLLQVGY